MTATNQDVIDEIGSLKSFHEQVIADAASATQSAVDAAAAANTASLKVNTITVLYLGGPNASDSSDGLTLNTPLSTMARLTQIMPQSGFVRVVILGDYVFDTAVNLFSPPSKIEFSSRDASTNMPAPHNLSRTSSGRFLIYTDTEIIISGFQSLDYGGAAGAISLFSFQGRKGTLYIQSTPLEKTGSGVLVSKSAFLDVDIANSPYGTGVPGSLIQGVAANADPNNSFGIRSTATSA